MKEIVLVDTCLWVPYFNRPQSAERQIIDTLLDENRVALIGPVLAEILQGFRRQQEADWVASALGGVHYIETEWDDWKMSAKLARHLATRQQRLPLTDLVVAAVAIRRNWFVYTNDPHFDSIVDVKRFPHKS